MLTDVLVLLHIIVHTIQLLSVFVLLKMVFPPKENEQAQLIRYLATIY